MFKKNMYILYFNAITLKRKCECNILFPSTKKQIANLLIIFAFCRKIERKMEWKTVEIAYTGLDHYLPGTFHSVIPFNSIMIKTMVYAKISTS